MPDEPIRIDRFKELRELSRRGDMPMDTEILSNLGFMSAILRQAHRSDIQILTRSAMQGLLAAHKHPHELSAPSKQAKLATLAVEIAEAVLRELEAKGHVLSR